MHIPIPGNDPLKPLSEPSPLREAVETPPLKKKGRVQKSEKPQDKLISKLISEKEIPIPSQPSATTNPLKERSKVGSDSKKLTKTFEISQIQDPTQLLDLIEKDETIFDKISEDKKDPEFILDAIKRNGKMISLLNEEEWNLVKTAIEHRQDLQKDKKFMMHAVARDGNLLKFASKKIREDQIVILQAVKQDGRSIQFASPYLFMDPLFEENFYLLKEAISQNYEAMEFVNKILSNLIQQKTELNLLVNEKQYFQRDKEWEDLINEKGEASHRQRQKDSEWKILMNSLRSDRQRIILESKLKKIISELIETNPEIIRNLGKNLLQYVSLYLEDKFEGEYLEHRLLGSQNDDNDVLKLRERIFAQRKKESNIGSLLSEIEIDPTIFEKLSFDLRCNRKFVLQAVKRNGLVLKNIPRVFLGDWEIISTAFNHSPGLGEFLSESDPEFMKGIIRRNERAIQYASSHIQREESVSLFQGDGRSIVALLKDPNTKEILRIGFEKICEDKNYKSILNKFIDSDDFYYVINSEPEFYKWLPMRLQIEQRIILRAIDKVPKVFRHTPFLNMLTNFLPKAEKEREIAFISVQKDPQHFTTLNPDLQNDRKIILAAVCGDGEILKMLGSIDPRYLEDEEIVSEAIKQNPYSFKYASLKLRGDEAFMEKAININPGTFRHASDEIRMNMRFAMMALKKDSKSFHHVHPTLKQDYAFLTQALIVDPLLLAYVEDPDTKEKLANDQEFMDALKALHGYTG